MTGRARLPVCVKSWQDLSGELRGSFSSLKATETAAVRTSNRRRCLWTTSAALGVSRQPRVTTRKWEGQKATIIIPYFPFLLPVSDGLVSTICRVLAAPWPPEQKVAVLQAIPSSSPSAFSMSLLSAASSPPETSLVRLGARPGNSEGTDVSFCFSRPRACFFSCWRIFFPFFLMKHKVKICVSVSVRVAACVQEERSIADLCRDVLKWTWEISEKKEMDVRLSTEQDRRYSSQPCSFTRGCVLQGSKKILFEVTSRIPETTPWEKKTH